MYLNSIRPDSATDSEELRTIAQGLRKLFRPTA